MPSLLINYLAAFGSVLATLVLCTGLIYSSKFFGAEPPARWAPTIAWLWRVTWMLWLVAVTTFVVLTLHYPVKNNATISPQLPLEEAGSHAPHRGQRPQRLCPLVGMVARTRRPKHTRAFTGPRAQRQSHAADPSPTP